jgi:hypothetical protein
MAGSIEDSPRRHYPTAGQILVQEIVVFEKNQRKEKKDHANRKPFPLCGGRFGNSFSEPVCAKGLADQYQQKRRLPGNVKEVAYEKQPKSPVFVRYQVIDRSRKRQKDQVNYRNEWHTFR